MEDGDDYEEVEEQRREEEDDKDEWGHGVTFSVMCCKIVQQQLCMITPS